VGEITLRVFVVAARTERVDVAVDAVVPQRHPGSGNGAHALTLWRTPAVRPERMPQWRPQAAVCTTAAIADVKTGRPSMPERIAAAVLGPKPGSTACSGCGIRPTTLPAALVRPAMSSSDPFGFTPT